MGSFRDWARVVILVFLWAASMMLWGYLGRRQRRSPPVRSFLPRARLGLYLFVLLVSLDFGLGTTFWTRLLHEPLLYVLVGVNLALLVVVFAFRLFSSPESQVGMKVQKRREG